MVTATNFKVRENEKEGVKRNNVKNVSKSKDGKKIKEERKEKHSKVKGELIAIVRVRGSVKVRGEIKETLSRLGLEKPNHCVIVSSTPVYLGMIKKAKDYITWGEIDEDTLSLLEKYASKEKERLYRLHPPIKGYERKGIKTTYSKGGALGYRGKDINTLITRMVEGMRKD